MAPNLSPYLADILDQPAALERFAESVPELRSHAGLGALKRPPAVLLTGMGASLAALRPAWLTLVQAGVPSWLLETSELVNDVPRLLTSGSGTVVVAASQSGRSAELLALVERVLPSSVALIAVTNDTDSPLGRAGTVTVDIRAGEEHAVSTRSYVNTLAAGQCVAAALADDGPPPELRAVAEGLADYLRDWRARVDHLIDVVAAPPRLFYLARGASLAAASCGALIAKEAAKYPVESMSCPQFRHGPLELADDRLTTVLLAGAGAQRDLNRRLHDDLQRLGATALWADGGQGADIPLPPVPDHGLPMAEIAALQLLSVALAEQTGVDAGTFRHLDKVTTVE